MFIKRLHELGRVEIYIEVRRVESQVRSAETSQVGQMAANWHHWVIVGLGVWGGGVCPAPLMPGQSLLILSEEYGG